MSRFAAKFENITSDEHGPSDNESEKWMQTLRSLDVGDILTKEDLNKVFFKVPTDHCLLHADQPMTQREPENPPMVQFADPAFLDFLRQCKELGRGDESVDKAIATCEAGEPDPPLPSSRLNSTQHGRCCMSLTNTWRGEQSGLCRHREMMAAAMAGSPGRRGRSSEQ
eukprot:352995-Hanusia_phi.AAC.3